VEELSAPYTTRDFSLGAGSYRLDIKLRRPGEWYHFGGELVSKDGSVKVPFGAWHRAGEKVFSRILRVPKSGTFHLQLTTHKGAIPGYKGLAGSDEFRLRLIPCKNPHWAFLGSILAFLAAAMEITRTWGFLLAFRVSLLPLLGLPLIGLFLSPGVLWAFLYLFYALGLGMVSMVLPGMMGFD
jgi:hypothetical protein